MRLLSISNTQEPHLVAYNLEKVGLKKYFFLILSSVSFGKRKPHPLIFQEALTALGALPHQTIFVGDNYEEDYKGALEAKLRSYLFDPQKKYLNLGNKRINTLLDLKKIL